MAKRLGAAVEIEYLDTGGLSFDLAAGQIRAGYEICGLYRLRKPDPSAA